MPKIKRLASPVLSVKRDQKLLQNPHFTYAKIRKKKRESASKINKLVVGPINYHGEYVQDGFYESVYKLKTIQKSQDIEHSPFENFVSDYSYTRHTSMP